MADGLCGRITGHDVVSLKRVGSRYLKWPDPGMAERRIQFSNGDERRPSAVSLPVSRSNRYARWAQCSRPARRNPSSGIDSLNL